MKIYRVLDDKGRFVIPKTLREMCELQSGDVVLVEDHEEGLLIRKSQFVDLKYPDENKRFENIQEVLHSLTSQEKKTILKELLESEMI